MGIEVSTATGSAYWASYLINGDATGIEDRDAALCDAWCKRLEPFYVVDVKRDRDGEAEEQYFSWSYGSITGDDCAGGDLIEYVIHRQKRKYVRKPKGVTA